MHLVLEQEDDVHNGNVDIEDDSVGNGYDDGAECVDGAEKHLAHHAQVADCHFVEICKQNKHLVFEQDDDVHNGNVNSEDDNVGNDDDD
eukprot:14361333-Ditylum_brightwellii.AAC.1